VLAPLIDNINISHGRPSCCPLLDRVALTAAQWPTNSHRITASRAYYYRLLHRSSTSIKTQDKKSNETQDNRATKEEPAPPPGDRSNSDRPSTLV